MINSTILRTMAVTVFVILLFQDVTQGQGGWSRLSNEIYGKRRQEQIGRNIDMSVDGTTIVASTDMVSTRVLKLNTVSRLWEQLGSDLLGDGKVAISNDGSTIAFGENGVYVYKFNSNDWVRIGTDFPYEQESLNDIALSADGTTIILGFPSLVKVYKFQPSLSRWMQVGPTFQGNAPCFNNFERFVGISADGVTIAFNDYIACNPRGDDVGQVIVYKYASAQSRWIQVGQRIDGDPTEVSPSGYSVSMSGDGAIIAFGSPLKGSFDLGYTSLVRAFKFQASSSRWIQMGSDIIGEGPFDSFGASIDLSLDGTTLAIGASSKEIAGFEYSGQVQVYKFSSTSSSWLQLGLDINGFEEYTTAGFSVALSSNGTLLAVGVPGSDGSTYLTIATGQINVYKYNSEASSRCDVTWRLFHSRPDRLIGPIFNGTVYTNPPPCNATNIEAIIVPTLSSCTITPKSRVQMKLYSQDMTRLLISRNETSRYFLFGNTQTDINNGRIAPGTYNLQVNVNGWNSPPTRFTLRGDGSCRIP